MASAASSKDPRELHALKQKAMEYYQENGVPAKMEEILNSMFYDEPQDVYGHLVNFFQQFTKPAMLSKLSAMQVYDSTGMPTIQTDVFCTVNNKEKHINASTIPSANIKVKPEEREKAEVEIQNSVVVAIKLINEELGSQVHGMDPLKQEEVDALVLSILEKKKEEDQAKKSLEEEKQETLPPAPSVEEKDKKKSAKKPVKKIEVKEEEGKSGKNSAPLMAVPDRPLENFVAGNEAAAAVSQAVCACAALAHGIPIYRHVGNLSRKKGAMNEFRIPLPMVTILHSGKILPGKVNCVKEYMIVPGVGMSVEKSIEHIQHIYNYVAKSFTSKLGPSAKFVNETGALCPPLDTPNQALDILQEAVNAQGLTIGEDMYLAINAAAHDFYDHEKGKYEVVTGTLKSPDDMVDFWADIISKYPSLVMLIDPVRGEDTEQWLKLCERVSEATYVVGDRFYNRPGLLRKEELANPIRTSGIVMNVEQMNTISDIIECSNKLQDHSNEIVISTNQGDTTDTFIVDFAVGLNARFLKIGGPSRGERSSKLNRLLQIFKELESNRPVSEERYTEASPEETGVIEEESQEQTEKEEEETEDGLTETEECTQQPEETKEVESEAGPVTWGENEASCLKIHSPFVFPVIENPPPPVEGGEEDAEEKSSSPSSKRSK